MNWKENKLIISLAMLAAFLFIMSIALSIQLWNVEGRVEDTEKVNAAQGQAIIEIINFLKQATNTANTQKK